MKPSHYFFFLVVAFYGHAQNPCSQEIKGQVLDADTKEPLPYATVKISDTSQGVVTNEKGLFHLKEICDGEVHLEVQFLGYKTFIHHHDFHHADPTIYLAPDETLLESVIVEDSKVDEIKSISVQKKEIDKLSLVNSTISSLAEEMTGVSILKTGTNISKPMIHGLHSNRVLVVNDGVRHAYQVWGQEHAPEIDPSHVDQIEIIKGAGTVKYGPEALGGVILYNSKKPVFEEKFNGSVGSSYQTNGRAFSSQLNLEQGFHRFAWNVGVFGIHQGDLQAPDYNLTNTGKQEYGASFNTLLHRPKFDLHVTGSYFEQDLGILRGSIVGNLTDLQNAIDRSIPNPSLPFTYDLQNPRQETQHGLIKSDLSLFLGDHILNIKYAAQQNVRREFDVRRGELNDRPVIDLTLLSHNLEADWIQPKKGNWSGNSGIQWFNHNSVNRPGSNPVNFVPDYDASNFGAFSIQSLTLNKTVLELGLRFDFQSLSVADTIREINIYANEVDYNNFTFTVGAKKQIGKTLSIFSNIGSAWRPPNVAELYSFGYHHSRIQFGLWRYELQPTISTSNILDENTKDVPSEKSIKWVSGLEIKKEKISAEFIVYANHIDNYIFLRPHGVTVNIAGTFPYFLYDQTNAFFLGSDWDIRHDHSEHLSSELKVSYVYAIERTNKQAFIEIPPLSIKYGVDRTKGNWGYGLNLSYTARQWHVPQVIEPSSFQNNNIQIDQNQIFDFMSAPEGYLLLGGNVAFKKGKWKFLFKGNNLLNTSYRSYTDRLRYFAEAPGRNLSFSASFRF